MSIKPKVKFAQYGRTIKLVYIENPKSKKAPVHLTRTIKDKEERNSFLKEGKLLSEKLEKTSSERSIKQHSNKILKMFSEEGDAKRLEQSNKKIAIKSKEKNIKKEKKKIKKSSSKTSVKKAVLSGMEALKALNNVTLKDVENNIERKPFESPEAYKRRCKGILQEL